MSLKAYGRCLFAALVFLLSLTAMGGESSAGRYVPLAGDWDGTGTVSIAWFDTDGWALSRQLPKDSTPVYDPPVDPWVFNPVPDPWVLGPQPWVPVTGKWTAGAKTTVKMFNMATWALVDAGSGPQAAGGADTLGSCHPWQPIAGNWDGNGVDTLRVYNRMTGELLRPDAAPPQSPCPADAVFNSAVAADLTRSGRDSLIVIDEKPANAVAFAGKLNAGGAPQLALFDAATGSLMTATGGMGSDEMPPWQPTMDAKGCWTTKYNVKHYFTKSGCMIFEVFMYQEMTCCLQGGCTAPVLHVKFSQSFVGC